MARVRFAPLVDQVRGRVGNVVFSDWRGIGTARKYAVSRNPDSSGQQLSRSAFRAGSGVWQGADTDLPGQARPPFRVNDLWRIYWRHVASTQGGRTGRNAWIGHWLEQTRAYVAGNFSPFQEFVGLPSPGQTAVRASGRTVSLSQHDIVLAPGWTPVIWTVCLIPYDLITRAKLPTDWKLGGAYGVKAVSAGQVATFAVELPGRYEAYFQDGSVRTGQPQTFENLRFGPIKYSAVTVS